MENRGTQAAVADFAGEVQSLLARCGLTADALMAAVCTDETGRIFNPTIVLGALVEGLNAQNEKERAPRVLSHLQRALTPQPSGRWMPLITRRAAQIKRETAPLVAQAFDALYDDSSRPGVFMRACVEACDAEIKALERRKTEAAAKVRQAEKELEPLQARINAFLQANASRRTITHLIELLTALLQVVDRGVGLTAVVLMAERLVNDREAHAMEADAAAAAMSILQQVRAQAQATREEIGRFLSRCRAVEGQIVAARSGVAARLSAHPYADVDLTEIGLVERLRSTLQAMPKSSQLARLVDMDEARLYQELYETALKQVRRQTAALSLLELMDMQATDALREAQEAGALPTDSDLVAATLEAAYRRIGSPAVELQRKAEPQDWWLVGVPDETNPGFAFENATLVGAGRRDQIQFLHVQVGIALQDLTAFAAARDAFERAAAQRNYYVLDSLATDDHARQVFALGLAGSVITVTGGAFAFSQDGSQITLGATVEDALDQFIQRADLIKVVEDQFNALTPAVVAERLQAYLARGRSVKDELWWEFASYVQERLELAQHQLTFVS